MQITFRSGTVSRQSLWLAARESLVLRVDGQPTERAAMRSARRDATLQAGNSEPIIDHAFVRYAGRLLAIVAIAYAGVRYLNRGGGLTHKVFPFREYM